MEQCDDDPQWPGWLYPAAPELAASIIEDGLAANKLRYVNRLIEVALRIVDGPMPTEPKNLARDLSAAAPVGRPRGVIRDKLRRAPVGDPVHRSIASANYGTLERAFQARSIATATSRRERPAKRAASA